jgi:two-component system response regulator MprA
MAITTVLVVDDDPKATDMLRRTLIYEGFRVITAANGVDALAVARDQKPAIMVLDWNMPIMDGPATLRRLREEDGIPVLMLTGRDALEDKVNALESGADDYLVKPFAPEELIARVRSLLRRTNASNINGPLSVGDLAFDPKLREVTRGGRRISLSPREHDLMLYFMQRPCMVLKREQLLRDVWGYDFGGDDGVLDVYIGYLRSKLEAAGESRIIHTVRHVGYVLKTPAESVGQ